MNVAQLKAALLSRGLSTGGKKDDLMLRLETAINAERASGAVFVIPEELSSVRATFEAIDLEPFPAVARRVLCKIPLALVAAADTQSGSATDQVARAIDWAKNLHSSAGIGPI